MTNERAVEILNLDLDILGQYGDETAEAYKMAIKALEAQPSEDCISREEVQDLISRWLSDYLLDETREALETINYKVGDMPPVKPERPKGKWIEVDVHNVYAALKCSVCNRVIAPFFKFGDYSYEDITKPYPYCHCGAEMGGADETN